MSAWVWLVAGTQARRYRSQPLDSWVLAQAESWRTARRGTRRSTNRRREQKGLCNCAPLGGVITIGSRRTAHGTLTETSLRLVPSGCRGWHGTTRDRRDDHRDTLSVRQGDTSREHEWRHVAPYRL